MCGPTGHWYDAVEDPGATVTALRRESRRLDVFTFFQQVPQTVPVHPFHTEPYPLAVLDLTSFEEWHAKRINKSMRRAIRKAEASGIEVRPTPFDDAFVAGVCDLYNETPMRQGRRFPHYGDSLEKVRRELGTFAQRSVFLGAYQGGQLVGSTKIVFLERVADVLQFLSRVSHQDRGVSAAMLACTVRISLSRASRYLVYGELHHGGLGEFKRQAGFVRMDLPRYFVPLSPLGACAIALRLHRRPSSFLPPAASAALKSLRRRWFASRLTDMS